MDKNILNKLAVIRANYKNDYQLVVKNDPLAEYMERPSWEATCLDLGYVIDQLEQAIAREDDVKIQNALLEAKIDDLYSFEQYQELKHKLEQALVREAFSKPLIDAANDIDICDHDSDDEFAVVKYDKLIAIFKARREFREALQSSNGPSKSEPE